MFDYQQRAATNEYRDGWDMIWGKKENQEILGINKVTENQCDGCNAGYPTDENGLHIVPYPSGPMVCQKLKYQEEKS